MKKQIEEGDKRFIVNSDIEKLGLKRGDEITVKSWTKVYKHPKEP